MFGNVRWGVFNLREDDMVIKICCEYMLIGIL